MRAFFTWLLFCLLATPVGAAEVMPAKPAQYFNDYAGVVSPDTASMLNQRLADFERQTSNQVVVAIFPKMQSDSSLEDYTHRVMESWQVGQAGKNNGVTFFVFVQEHRMRIEVGYGLEGALPDATAKRILDDEVTPHFKSADYDGGVTAGVTAILQAVRGEYKGTGRTVHDAGRMPGSRGPGGFDPGEIFQFIFLLFVIFSVIRAMRRGGTVYGRSGLSTYSNMAGFMIGSGRGFGGGGWGGGGGFGGGGGGGGGGGFSGGGGSGGGGGASGSW